MLLCFTTHLSTYLHAQLEPFPAFLIIFRREEVVIMSKVSLPLMSMGRKQLLVLTLISKIVDKSYAISKYMGKCTMIYRSFISLTVLSYLEYFSVIHTDVYEKKTTFILY